MAELEVHYHSKTTTLGAGSSVRILPTTSNICKFLSSKYYKFHINIMDVMQIVYQPHRFKKISKLNILTKLHIMRPMERLPLTKPILQEDHDEIRLNDIFNQRIFVCWIKNLGCRILLTRKQAI